MNDWYNVVSTEEIKKERKKARDLRASQWWKNLIGQGKCHYCENKFNSKELTMDHIVPIARGGKSTKGNVVPSCKECNSKKKLKTPVEDILSDLKNK
ncbi:MAG: HNH endonuclease [Oligoflexia bacterium]|nr:HNH endonuclease [Oligoflexia bacterium]